MAKGYGKRPLWQWIVLYLVIGIVVYGLVYYFFFRGSGYNYNPTTSNNGNTAPQTQQGGYNY